jgi:hypothetical protein
MKSFKLIFFFLTFWASAYSQSPSLIFKDTLTLDPLHSWITVPNTNTLWEIGIPNKTGMNDTYDGDAAIITKLNENYSLNSSDYFYLNIPHGYTWGSGTLSFWHKYNTDSLKDGGVIEVSFDNGKTWENIISYNNDLHRSYSGLYSENDTIIGGINAFTGNSYSWKKVELSWIWLMAVKSTGFSLNLKLRFKFISTGSSQSKAGWELSHFVFDGYDVQGSVNNSLNQRFSVSPNPAHDIINIDAATNGAVFKLFNTLGVLVYEAAIKDKNQNLNISGIIEGQYFYTILENNKIIGSGQLIKK